MKKLVGIIVIIYFVSVNFYGTLEMLNDKRIADLRLYGVTTIILAFDGDKPGRDAARHFIRNNEKHYVVKNYDLPDGEDWNSLSKDLLIKFSKELLD